MNDYILVDGVLCHHGIKNQKWGVRRFQNEDGSLTPEGRKRYGVDNSGNNYTSQTYKNVSAKSLSDKELESAKKRLQSEKEYNKLVNEVSRPALAKAKKVIVDASTEAAKDLLKKGMTAVGTYALGRFLEQYGFNVDGSLNAEGRQRAQERAQRRERERANRRQNEGGGSNNG